MPSPVSVRWARRLVQTLFLLIFLWLLLATFYHGLKGEGETISDSLPYPVSLFLYLDPLAAISTLLAAKTLHHELLWSLFVLVPTLFLGRWFCGWVCPFGAIHNFFSEVFKKKASLKIKRNKTKKSQVLKYQFLFFFLGSALTGTLWLVGILDPICFLIRALGLSILPALDHGARGGVELLTSGELSNTLHRFLDVHFMGPVAHRFYAGWFIGGLFLLVVGLNLYMSRFWCRILCPLGALLGVFSRFTIFNLHKHPEKCTACNLCLRSCQGAASPEKETKWRPSECFVCYNCVADCQEGALDFKVGVQGETMNSSTDLTRRGFMASLAIGMGAFPLLRAARDPEKNPISTNIRPPGACEETEFLKRCIKCGQCMKVCPNNAVHPAIFQGGAEGVFSPVMIPRIGYCEPTCVLCGQVCPTGAIRKFTEEHKKKNQVKIGTAFFDRGRCLPWAMAKNCMVCEEFCPTSPKAIWFDKTQGKDRDGNPIELNLPHVDPNQCTGCGVCENVCPVTDKAAVRVTSVGEKRSKKNRILLED